MTTRGRESMRTRLCSHRAMLTRIILGNYLRRVSMGSWWGSPCTCRIFPYRAAAKHITWSMWRHSMTAFMRLMRTTTRHQRAATLAREFYQSSGWNHHSARDGARVHRRDRVHGARHRIHSGHRSQYGYSVRDSQNRRERNLCSSPARARCGNGAREIQWPGEVKSHIQNEHRLGGDIQGFVPNEPPRSAAREWHHLRRLRFERMQLRQSGLGAGIRCAHTSAGRGVRHFTGQRSLVHLAEWSWAYGGQCWK